MVYVGDDQEKVQSERNSHSKTEVGKNKLTIRFCTLRRQVEKCMMMQDYIEYGMYDYMNGIKID